MKSLVKQLAVGCVVVMALAATETPAYAKEKGVAGSWTLSAEGYVLKLVLVQRGTKISGTLEGTHGPMPLKGTFVKGRITFSGAGSNGIGGKEEFSAIGLLQSDGTLAGDLTSKTAGKLTWTAVRDAPR